MRLAHFNRKMGYRLSDEFNVAECRIIDEAIANDISESRPLV